MPARYDGFASWYDERLLPYTMAASDSIERLLGPGSGRCLDLCCGTGAHLQTLVALGWRVTGVDISEDQLRVARQRARNGVELIRAAAAALPLAAGRFDAVVSMFSHTDVDDFRPVVREAARVLRPGGVFIYVGLHPCFEGPHSRYEPEDDVPVLHRGTTRLAAPPTRPASRRMASGQRSAARTYRWPSSSRRCLMLP